MSNMIVKLFKPRFAGLVQARIKRQTVRPTPRRMPKVGQTISLREWTGLPYRSKQRVLGTSVITRVVSVIIDHGMVMGCFIYIERVMLGFADALAFAKADGFADLKDMESWFLEEHGLPFGGILIAWE